MPFHKQHNIRTYTWDEGGRNLQASKITNNITEGGLQYQGGLEGSKRKLLLLCNELLVCLVKNWGKHSVGLASIFLCI